MKRFLALGAGILLTCRVALAQGATNDAAAAMAKRLEAIVFRDVQFNEANLNDVVPYLAGSSKGFDPAGKGANIILLDRDNQAGINMDFKQLSLQKILEIICRQSGLTVEFEGETVLLKKPEPTRPAAGA